jgi:hypothetical protein
MSCLTVTVHIERHPEAPIWKLVGTEAEGTFCHKPCTVSGGGKSEISKSISNSIIYGSYYVDDLNKAFDQVEVILNYDYSHVGRKIQTATHPHARFCPWTAPWARSSSC